MKTIFGLIAFSIVSASLLIWLLVLGFQTQSLVDVFTIGNTFGSWSAYDILFTYLPLSIMLLPFIIISTVIIIKSERLTRDN